MSEIVGVSVLIILSFILLLVGKISRRPNDPVYFCELYRRDGCSHVDGFLCDFDTCKERKEFEIRKLEQELDIPIKDRM